jgi:hypothetical protein
MKTFSVVKCSLCILSCLAVSSSFAQAPQSDIAPQWQKTLKTDAFNGTSYIEYTVTGKFLQAPSDSASAAPVMTLRCTPGRHGLGYHIFKNGQLIYSNISIGAVVDHHPDGVYSTYRLDDGKPKLTTLAVSTAGTSLFFDESQANDFFFGHSEKHRENTGDPIRKLVLMVDQAFAGKIVAEFDIPDPSEMSDNCGLVSHKQS